MSTAATQREGRPAMFVTGAASGIGRACAELFARHGWFVGLYDVDADGAEAVAAALGQGSAVAGALDVSDADAWQRALAEFWVHSGERLDLLFNNAGILASLGISRSTVRPCATPVRPCGRRCPG